jgi:hypothetical protein
MVLPQPGRWHRARYHVQVKLDRQPIYEPGTVSLSGRVMTVFRGDDRLAIGDKVHFFVSAYRHRDDVTPWGGAYTHVDVLNKAKFMEVLLDGDPPYCLVTD